MELQGLHLEGGGRGSSLEVQVPPEAGKGGETDCPPERSAAPPTPRDFAF